MDHGSSVIINSTWNHRLGMPQSKHRPFTSLASQANPFLKTKAQAMKSRIKTIGRTRIPNNAEIKAAGTSAVIIFSIVMGAASRKLLSTAMRPTSSIFAHSPASSFPITSFLIKFHSLRQSTTSLIACPCSSSNLSRRLWISWDRLMRSMVFSIQYHLV
jgi:hypothetical protein